jgi:hypothetical protein
MWSRWTAGSSGGGFAPGERRHAGAAAMTTAEVLDHLRGRGLGVIERRRGATVTCPAHEDRRPSLDVTTGRDGRTLMTCRAGCRTEDVVQAAGLRLGDLFATPAPPRVASTPRTPLEWARAEALALAHRQPWTRHRARYAAADAIRAADRARAQYQTPTDDAHVWDRLAEAAALTTAAENVLAAE